MNANEFITRKQNLASMLDSDTTQAIDAYVSTLIQQIATYGTFSANFTIDNDVYWLYVDGLDFELVTLAPDETYSWQDLTLIIMGLIAQAKGMIDDVWQVFGKFEVATVA